MCLHIIMCMCGVYGTEGLGQEIQCQRFHHTEALQFRVGPCICSVCFFIQAVELLYSVLKQNKVVTGIAYGEVSRCVRTCSF